MIEQDHVIVGKEFWLALAEAFDKLAKELDELAEVHLRV